MANQSMNQLIICQTNLPSNALSYRHSDEKSNLHPPKLYSSKHVVPTQVVFFTTFCPHPSCILHNMLSPPKLYSSQQFVSYSPVYWSGYLPLHSLWWHLIWNTCHTIISEGKVIMKISRETACQFIINLSMDLVLALVSIQKCIIILQKSYVQILRNYG